MSLKKFLLPVAMLSAALIWTGCGEAPQTATEEDVSVAAAPLTMVATDSSVFSSVGYDRAAEELVLVFRETDRTYVYTGIPATVGEAFIAADSLGGYYHGNIRGQYPSEER